jgi:hypothetical protein
LSLHKYLLEHLLQSLPPINDSIVFVVIRTDGLFVLKFCQWGELEARPITIEHLKIVGDFKDFDSPVDDSFIDFAEDFFVWIQENEQIS